MKNLPKSCCVVHHAFLKKNTTELRSPTTEARRCGSELDPTGTAPGILPDSGNPSRPHWSLTASSPDVSLTLPVATLIERSTLRCRGQHRSPTADAIEVGSLCVRKWCIQVLESRLHLTPDVSGRGLLCLLSSFCKHWSGKIGSDFQPTSHVFQSTEKPTHRAASGSINQPLAHSEWSCKGPAQSQDPLKRLDPTTWSKPTSRPSPTRLRGTSPRSVRLVLQRSKSPGSPTGVHWPVLKPVDVERSDLGRVQQTSDNSERRTCLFFRRCPWPEAVHVLMPSAPKRWRCTHVPP